MTKTRFRGFGSIGDPNTCTLANINVDHGSAICCIVEAGTFLADFEDRVILFGLHANKAEQQIKLPRGQH